MIKIKREILYLFKLNHVTISIYVLFFSVLIASCKQNNGVQLTLPPQIYCNNISEMSIYFDNLIEVQNRGEYTFKITPDLGKKDSTKYTFHIHEKEAHNYKLNVAVFDKSGKKVAAESTTLYYTPLTKTPADTINILLTGNSLTNAGYFAARVKSLFTDTLNFPVKFLGTRKNHGGIHEGYGGKTWKWFTQNGKSPFVFNLAEGDTTLHFKHYFENVVNTSPDYVVVELGINDCFRADTSSVAAIDSTIDEMLKYTTVYLENLIEYKNDIQIGVCLVPAANSNASGFIANYGDKYTQSGWTKIQRRVNKRYIDFFKKNFNSNCSLIPLQINIDTYNAYPADNGVHPKPEGYYQFASTIFSWLFYKIEE